MSTQTKSVHYRLSLVLKAILIIEAAFAVWEQQWQTAAITGGIIAITLFPLFMEKQFRVYIPSIFEFLAVLFIFASLFLGEVRDYYLRFWWWDTVLHAASGLLFGIIGFLMVHIINETRHVEFHMKPGFVAFFAFLFAVGIGTIWEIFEFGMDSIFGMNMQKAMLGDPSGLTDTMWDLIVDTLGALVIAVLGYGYQKASMKDSFIKRWIYAFIKSNPRLFRRLP